VCNKWTSRPKSVTCKVAEIAFAVHLLTQTHSFILVLFMTGHLVCEDRGSTVVKVLRYKSEVAGSIPDGVFGIFH